jgi:hypothetical protein
MIGAPIFEGPNKLLMLQAFVLIGLSLLDTSVSTPLEKSA